MAEKLEPEMWGDRPVTKIRCQCRRILLCPNFTNTCACGRDYNWNGSLLAPRSEWGSETGETAGEILAIDGMTPEQCFEED